MKAEAEDIRVIEVETHLKDGQVKCPKCGATDISTNTATGKLRCNFCRHEFELELAHEDEEITTLTGTSIRGGAKDIDEESEDLITLKCESCGAEVVVDTRTSTQARCHWCRNTLSINNQIPNGAVPDVILPFSVSKEDARKKIDSFVHARRFFAHPTFTREFTSENISGVYIPYMLVDVNGHMKLTGRGEIQTASREVGDDDHKHYEYDADVYQVGREFDILIDDLSIESSADKLDYNSKEKTTNIINSIMPFDTENCVAYNANYLTGYTSEKRDMNIGVLREVIEAQSSDVARLAAKETIKEYDRGVSWEEEEYEIKGDSWKAAYLPVWLYSYMEREGKNHLMHYVAVNARTEETMGSVPINFKKLFAVSAFVEIFGGIAAYLLNLLAMLDQFDGTKFQESRGYFWLLLVSGFVFYYTMYLRYRNANERHHYEEETKHEMTNLIQTDDFLRHDRALDNQRILGENTSEIKGNKLNLRKNEKLKRAIEKGVLDEAIEHKKKLEELDREDHSE